MIKTINFSWNSPFPGRDSNPLPALAAKPRRWIWAWNLVPGHAGSTWSQTKIFRVRFQVLTVTNMKIVVFWVVAPGSLIQVYRHFRSACCLHNQVLMKEAVRTSETSINFYQTARSHSPHDSHLQNFPDITKVKLGLCQNTASVSGYERLRTNGETSS
jgi:hypothetical protein